MEENIKQTFLNPSSVLFEEPTNLLKQEVREQSIYNAIISVIASDATKLAEISVKTGEESSACSAYIKNLMSLGIVKKETPIIIVDIHAEATAEKICMAKYFAKMGVSAVFGTHTHVQTADERNYENCCGYITDAGFCGSPDGVIGMDYASSLSRFLTAIPVRYEVAEPLNIEINAVEVTCDELRATDIKRINISYAHKNEGMEAESEGGP